MLNMNLKCPYCEQKQYFKVIKEPMVGDVIYSKCEGCKQVIRIKIMKTKTRTEWRSQDQRLSNPKLNGGTYENR